MRAGLAGASPTSSCRVSAISVLAWSLLDYCRPTSVQPFIGIRGLPNRLGGRPSAALRADDRAVFLNTRGGPVCGDRLRSGADDSTLASGRSRCRGVGSPLDDSVAPALQALAILLPGLLLRDVVRMSFLASDRPKHAVRRGMVGLGGPFH